MSFEINQSVNSYLILKTINIHEETVIMPIINKETVIFEILESESVINEKIIKESII